MALKRDAKRSSSFTHMCSVDVERLLQLMNEVQFVGLMMKTNKKPTKKKQNTI